MSLNSLIKLFSHFGEYNSNHTIRFPEKRIPQRPFCSRITGTTTKHTKSWIYRRAGEPTRRQQFLRIYLSSVVLVLSSRTKAAAFVATAAFFALCHIPHLTVVVGKFRQTVHSFRQRRCRVTSRCYRASKCVARGASTNYFVPDK